MDGSQPDGTQQEPAESDVDELASDDEAMSTEGGSDTDAGGREAARKDDGEDQETGAPTVVDRDDDHDLPILGIGEHGERIFCFSKIFSGAGLTNFFDEYEEEDRKNVAKAREAVVQMREKLAMEAAQTSPRSPPDPVARWLADSDSSDVEDEASDSDSNGQGDTVSTSESSMSDADTGTHEGIESDTDASDSSVPKEQLAVLRERWQDDIIHDIDDLDYNAPPWKWGWSLRAVIPEDVDILDLGPNYELESGAWTKDIIWDAADIPKHPPKIILDLNDPHMTFTLREGVDPALADHLVKHSAAVVLPPPVKREIVRGPAVSDDPAAQWLAYFNVSNDEHYRVQQSGRREMGVHSALSHHSVPALMLSTLPLNLSDQQLLEFHRQKATWCPDPDSVLSTRVNSSETDVEITFRSVTGRTATVVRKKGEADADSVGDLYSQVEEKAFPEAGSRQPTFLSGSNLQPLASTGPLPRAESKSAGRQIVIWVVFPQIQMLSGSMLSPKPDAKGPARPPRAFVKRKDLTAVDGHTIVMEYLEEHPLLLGYSGMGVTLQTWYQAKDASDTGDQMLIEQNPKGKRWKLGAVKMLNSGETTPFLGGLQGGTSQLAVESPMFRSVSVAHDTAPTDFLLIRSPAGSLSLRKIKGTVAVGQQQPLIKIPQPAVSTIKDFEERRLVVYACRKLRQKAHKLEKGGEGAAAEVTVEELSALFQGLSESVIKARLKDKCSCIPKRGEEGSFVLRQGATLPSEQELRQRLTPEDVCAFDGMRRYRARLANMGLRDPGKFFHVSQDKWKLALELLPEAKHPAALAIMHAFQNTPWHLSEGYHSWKGGRGQVVVAGPGDPTGRGLGISYLKEQIRKGDESRQPVRQPSGITGTQADLRRLGTEDAIKALNGLPERARKMININVLKQQDRWNIIKFVREVATVAVQEGEKLTGNLAKFARNPRSAAQVVAGLKRKCEGVYERQVKHLRGEHVEPKDQEIPKLELRNEDIPMKTGAQRIHRVIVFPDGSEEHVYLSMDRYDLIKWSGKGSSKNRVIEGRRPLPKHTDESAERAHKRLVPSKRPRPHAPNSLASMRKAAQRRSGANQLTGTGTIKFKIKPSVNERKSNEGGTDGTARKKSKSSSKGGKTPTKQMSQSAMETAASQAALSQDLSQTMLSGAISGLSPSLAGEPSSPERKGKKERRQKTGRKVLNRDILMKVLQSITRHPQARHFKNKVNQTVVHDYNSFVDKADEMWTEKIAGRLKGLKYRTADEFRQDVLLLRKNAIAYNTPGKGAYGGEAFIKWAEEMCEICESELAKYKEQISEQESRIT
eukprot:evm.model.scf_125.2 EVM.evm.TU.scf_125.2   scf_125:22519-35862(+)